jgi:hypothetical protein
MAAGERSVHPSARREARGAHRDGHGARETHAGAREPHAAVDVVAVTGVIGVNRRRRPSARLTLLLASILLLGATTGRTARSSPFPASPDWSSGPSTLQATVAVGDVNGDGLLDLVCGDFTQPTSLYLNTGRTFTLTPAWSTTRLDPTQSIALGDIDHDGDLDLVCGNLGQKSVLYGNDNGSYAAVPAWTAAHVRSTEDVALGDVDGDGYLDLVLGNQSEPCEVYHNEGGMFGAEPVWSAASADSTACVALGDVDGDGDLDLVCGSQAHQGRPLLLYRNGGGTFEPIPAWSSRDSLQAVAVALGDVDGDGRLDLVCGTVRQGIRLYLNQGDSFADQPAWSASAESMTESLALGDVDGDGDLDLVAGNFGQKSALYLNEGGALSPNPAWQSNAADRVYTVALADINADGALDLICGNSQQSTALYLNQGIVFSADPIWVSGPEGRITSVALGDVDGDGSVDLVAGGLDAGNVLYHNDGGTFAGHPTWRSERVDRTRSVALGDIDADGRPDLVCGNTRGASMYTNVGGTFPPTPSWVLDSGDSTTAIALGDLNGDARPDLVCGITGTFGARSKLYLNEDGRLSAEPAWVSGLRSYTWAVALGDIDGDRDLDLVLGNQNASNTLFRNNGGVLSAEPVWSSNPPAFTSSVALGDVDGDGTLDLVCGNGFNGSTFYANEGSILSPDPSWSSTDSPPPLTLSVALGDVDGDGDLDLVCGNSGFALGSKTTLFRNEDGHLTISPVWSSGPVAYTQSVALGDIDDDGDLDLVCGNGKPFEAEGGITIYEGMRAPPYHGDLLAPVNQLPFTTAFLRRVRVEASGPNSRRVSFEAFDLESDPIWILAEYQFEGDPAWLPVEVAGRSGRLGPLSSSPAGVEHSFEWDVTRIPGDRRNVVLRLRTISPPRRVSVIRDVAAYLRQVGRIVPQRAEIAVSTELLAFATVTLGDTVSVPLDISNQGNAELTISDITLPSAEMRLDRATPLRCVPGQTIRLQVLVVPRAETEISGHLHILSNDPVAPDKAIAVQTDIRSLRISSRLLTPGPQSPLGEAVTVIVTPAPQVRIEGGFLFHRTAGGGRAFADSLPLARSAGDFIGVIPGSAVREAGLEYYIRVENSGIRATDPPAAPDSTFTQSVAPPQQIVSTPSPNLGVAFLESRPIRVEIGVPQGAEFVRGTLHYRRGGERGYQTAEVISAAPFPAGTIPDSACSARGVEYWVEVETLTRRLTDPPQSPSDHPRSISITVSNLIEPHSHPGLVYRMFSVPLLFGEELTGTIEALLSDQVEFGPYDPTRWRAFRYDPDLRTCLELGSVGASPAFRPLPGKSFWLISREENRIATAPWLGLSVPTDSIYTIVLKPGWNQVGNPFAFPVSWRETQVDGQGSVENAPERIEPPVSWSGRDGYRQDVERLEPFEGYWLKNLTTEDLRWRIPARNDSLSAAARGTAWSPGEGRSPGGIDHDSGSSGVDWGIRVLAHADGASDLGSLAAVRGGARRGWDRYDRSEPPSTPGRSLSLYFPHGDWPLHPGDYTQDVRGGPDRVTDGGGSDDFAEPGWGYTWPFEVVLDDPAEKLGAEAAPATGREVTLEFETVGTLPPGAKVCLIDRDLEQAVPVQEVPDYRLLAHRSDPEGPRGPARFALLVGDERYLQGETAALSGAPAATALWPPAPNPARAALSIRYDLARPSRVDLSIFDVAGALVKTMSQGSRPAGRYRLSWDGRDGSGRMVSSGVYYLRLRAGEVSQGRRIVWVW